MPQTFRLKTGIPSLSDAAKAAKLTAVQPSDIRKEVYVLLSQYATAGVYENSFFLQLLKEKVNIFDGWFEEVGIGTTINITIELEILGDFIADICLEMNYDEEEFAMISVSGGGAYRVGLKNCYPCLGNNCGEDAYDALTVQRRSLKSNAAFAKALDYAFATGKNIKTGLPVDGFTSIMDGAHVRANTELGLNSVDDLLKMFRDMANKMSKSQFDFTTGATGTAGQPGYKPNILNNAVPRKMSDFVLLISFDMQRKLEQFPKLPFTWLQREVNLGTGFETKYVGSFSNGVRTYAVPDWMINDNDAMFLDMSNYVANIICIDEKYYPKGYDHKFKNTAYYAKEWQYFATRITGTGNFTQAIPKRDDNNELLMYKERTVPTTAP